MGWMHNSLQKRACMDLLDCILESIVSLNFIPLGGNKNKIFRSPKTWIPQLVVKNGDASHGRIRNKNHQLNKQEKEKGHWLASWWLNQPICKITRKSNWIISLGRGKNK